MFISERGQYSASTLHEQQHYDKCVPVDPMPVTYNYHFTKYEEELKWKLAIRLNKDKKFRLLVLLES